MKNFRPKKKRLRGGSQPTPTNTTPGYTRKRREKDMGTVPPVSMWTEGISGKQAKVTAPTNKVAETKLIKQENGREIRDAEKDISEMVTDLRKPSEIDHSKIKPTVSKEMHAFIRAHNTMPLSMLKTIDKMHLSQKKAAEQMVKAALVSQMKQERLDRKEKIEEYQAAARKVIMEWKVSEEAKLTRVREKQKKEKEERQVRWAAQQQKMADAAKSRTEIQQLASKFSQQNAMITNTLSRETRRYTCMHYV